MLKYIRLIILVFIFAPNLQAQNGDEKLFVEYLIKSEKYEKAIYAIDQLDTTKLLFSRLDSFKYLKAYSFFALKSLDSSAFYFQQVKQRELKEPSILLASYSLCYTGKNNMAFRLLEDFKIENKSIAELRSLQLAGISLLKRDTASYHFYSRDFNYEHFALVNEESVLNQLYMDLLEHKPKNYVAAGVMSAVIPGLGKIYTGKIGEGVYSFLTNLVLAAITYENYTKLGPTHFKTIFFGSMFTTFYVGNIYGSIASVKKYRDEFNYETDYRILLHLHIPLRSFYF